MEPRKFRPSATHLNFDSQKEICLSNKMIKQASNKQSPHDRQMDSFLSTKQNYLNASLIAS